MTNDESQQSASTGGPSVGQRLKDAREKAGLSLADVAEHQHLRVSVIQAIENGWYERIDSELFLKGYVRAYAGQLGLPADAMIADLNQELEPRRQAEEQAQENHPLKHIERRRDRKRKMARVILIAFCIVVLALLASYVFEGTVDADRELGADTAYDVAPAQNGVTEDLDLYQPSTVPLEPENVPVQSDEPVMNGEAAEGVDEVAPLAAPEPAPVDSQELATMPEPVSNDSTLTISFSGDCWVSIRDANGESLVSALQQAGSTLNVAGEGPFTIVLGAVSEVSELLLDGERIDLSRFRAVNNRVSARLGG
ncbi:MAG: DUF4115 domain-containing protein [Marinobacter sp.]|nr:DUF4115 domain-containing protein [Marinobacter sp.]